MNREINTNRISFLNTYIDNLTAGEAKKAVDQFIQADGFHYVVTPNSDIVVKMQDDPELKNICDNADLILTDGQIVVKLSKWLGNPIKERVCMTDFVWDVFDLAVDKGYKVFLFGGKEDVLKKATENIKKRVPQLQIVDSYSPPFGFEKNEEQVRFLRAQKNRFGTVDELGIFAMTEAGLIPVEDPSTLFITRRSGQLPAGVASVPVFEGSRVFLVEIQALTVPAKASITRVYSDKIDSARVSRVAAVLEKRAGLRFSDQDIYINVAGGVRLTESAIDGALVAALYSARTDLPLPENAAIVGELSLAGEIRPVNRIKQRAKAASGLGYSTVLAPEKEEGVTCVKDLKSLIKALFSK